MTPLTNQIVFDRVCEHLAKQKMPAISANGNCCYRDPRNGLMCAIGCLIPDEIYQPSWDQHQGVEVLQLLDEESVRNLFRDVSHAMLSSLQIAHDKSHNLKSLKKNLTNAVVDNGLYGQVDMSKLSLIKEWTVTELGDDYSE